MANVTEPTQVRHPVRATARTVFSMLVAFAALVPVVTATAGIPLVGLAGIVVTVAGAVTRVMAIPAVNDFLAKYFSVLAAKPTDELR